MSNLPIHNDLRQLEPELETDFEKPNLVAPPPLEPPAPPVPPESNPPESNPPVEN